jgi:hypothetical protein
LPCVARSPRLPASAAGYGAPAGAGGRHPRPCRPPFLQAKLAARLPLDGDGPESRGAAQRAAAALGERLSRARAEAASAAAEADADASAGASPDEAALREELASLSRRLAAASEVMAGGAAARASAEREAAREQASLYADIRADRLERAALEELVAAQAAVQDAADEKAALEARLAGKGDEPPHNDGCVRAKMFGSARARRVCFAATASATVAPALPLFLLAAAP